MTSLTDGADIPSGFLNPHGHRIQVVTGGYDNVELVPRHLVERYASQETTAARAREVGEHIATTGRMEPLILQYHPATGEAYLGEGNHRLRAAHTLQLDHVPVRVTRNVYGLSGPGVATPQPHPAIAAGDHVPADIRPSDLGLTPRTATARMDGHLVLYHGTTADKINSIQQSGLRPPVQHDGSARWFMLTDDYHQAADYSAGQAGEDSKRVVLEYHVPREKAYRRDPVTRQRNADFVLWDGQPHMGATAYALKSPLTGEYLHTVHDVTAKRETPRAAPLSATAFFQQAATHAPSRQMAVQGEEPKTYTWQGQAYGPDGGYIDKTYEVQGPLYHGGGKRWRDGQQIKPGRKPNPWGDEYGKSSHVYFTTSLDTAADYARQSGGHVFQVEPTGDFRVDHTGDDYKTRHPLNVLRTLSPHEWDTSRTAAAPHHLARTPDHEDYEPPEEAPGHAPHTATRAYSAHQGGTDGQDEREPAAAGAPGHRSGNPAQAVHAARPQQDQPERPARTHRQGAATRGVERHPDLQGDLDRLGGGARHVQDTIDSLQRGASGITTYPLSAPLSGWHAAITPGGQQVIHRTDPDTKTLHIGYAGHNVSDAEQRLGASDTDHAALPVEFHTGAEKDFDKLHPDIQNKALDTIDRLSRRETHPTDHGLTGRLAGWRAARADFLNRITHRYEDSDGNPTSSGTAARLLIGHIGPHNYEQAQKRLSATDYFRNTATMRRSARVPYTEDTSDDRPTTFEYHHNSEGAGDFGATYGQHIEPHGRYISQGALPEHLKDDPRYEGGTVTFQRPLRLPFGGGYDEDTNWKHQVSQRYQGRTGRELSDAIRADGYDGIMTHDEYGPTETVDLTHLSPDEERYSINAKEPQETDHASRRVEAAGVDHSDGIMIAIVPPPEIAAQLALEGGQEPDDLHVTLAYLGKLADYTPEQLAWLPELVGAWAARQQPVQVRIGGVGKFHSEHVLYAACDIPGGSRLHADLEQYLTGHGYRLPSEHGWQPHMTLAYVTEHARFMPKLPALSWEADTVQVVVRAVRQSVSLGSRTSA